MMANRIKRLILPCLLLFCLFLLTGCESSHLVIPEGTTEIAEGAYKNKGYETVVIPDSVTRIGKNAFNGCTRLKEITIPDSVTSIGDFAFGGCTALKTAVLPGNCATGRGSAVRDSLSDSSGSYERVFRAANTGKLKYPENLAVTITGPRISDGKFENCEFITSAVISETVTEIGEEAFERCNGLESVTIPDSVTLIGKEAFLFCTNLASAPLPDSVKTIGRGAFHGCKSLTEAVIPSSVTIIEDTVFWSCSGLKSVVIPDSVTSIGDWAFASCSSLSKVTIPDSVTIIGSAFYDCSSLTEISIPASVISLNNTFKDCTGLTSIVVPDSVTYCSSDTFDGCTGLTFLTIPGNILHSHASDEPLPESLRQITLTGTGIADKAVYNHKRIQEVIMADTVTEIGSDAFADCVSLTSVAVSPAVKHIQSRAFKGCTSLTEIILPDSLETIESSVFEGCESLSMIALPPGLWVEPDALSGTYFSRDADLFSGMLPPSNDNLTVSCPENGSLAGSKVYPMIHGLGSLMPEDIRTYDSREADYALISRVWYITRTDYTGPAHDTITDVFLCSRTGEVQLIKRFYRTPPVSGWVLQGASLGGGGPTNEEIWDICKNLF